MLIKKNQINPTQINSYIKFHFSKKFPHHFTFKFIRKPIHRKNLLFQRAKETRNLSLFALLDNIIPNIR